jgi:hypothetical protein
MMLWYSRTRLVKQILPGRFGRCGVVRRMQGKALGRQGNPDTDLAPISHRFGTDVVPRFPAGPVPTVRHRARCLAEEGGGASRPGSCGCAG